NQPAIPMSVTSFREQFKALAQSACERKERAMLRVFRQYCAAGIVAIVCLARNQILDAQVQPILSRRNGVGRQACHRMPRGEQNRAGAATWRAVVTTAKFSEVLVRRAVGRVGREERLAMVVL